MPMGDRHRPDDDRLPPTYAELEMRIVAAHRRRRLEAIMIVIWLALGALGLWTLAGWLL